MVRNKANIKSMNRSKHDFRKPINKVISKHATLDKKISKVEKPSPILSKVDQNHKQQKYSIHVSFTNYEIL